MEGQEVLPPGNLFENIGANPCNLVHFGVKNKHFEQMHSNVHQLPTSNYQNEELDGQAGQLRDRVDRGIAAQVRARLYYVKMAILNWMPKLVMLLQLSSLYSSLQ